MRRLNSPIIAIALLAGFMALSYYAYPRPIGYDSSVFSVLDRHTAIKLPKNAVAASIRDLYYIEAREVSAGIDLFGEGVQ